MSAHGTPSERFWAKVTKTEACWLWTAFCNADGYAKFKVGTSGPTIAGHIYAYQELVGKVPPRLELDHLCRVRACVNPSHLQPVSHLENVRRGQGGVNMRSKTHCPSGHEYSVTNTRIYKGARACRACDRARKKPQGVTLCGLPRP